MISAKSLASNFSIQATGKVLSVLIGLVVIAVITRSLGRHDFGEYTTAITFLQFFGVLVDFGLTLTLIVMISQKGRDEKKIVGNFFGLRLVSGLLLFSLAPIVVLFFDYSTVVKWAVLYGALSYFLMGGATMLVGIFQKHEAMWRVAVAELINRAIIFFLVLLVAYFQLGVVAFIASSILANGVWLWMMVRFAKPYVTVTPLFDFGVWKEIFFLSWPIAISIVFNLLYLKGDILFLAHFRDPSEVGLYGISYRVLDVLTVLPTMFMGLVLPSFVHLWSTGDKEKFGQYLKRVFDVFMVAIIPIVVGTQIVAGDVIALIAGNEFLPATAVLQWIIFAMFFVFVGTLFGHLVVAINKQKQMTWGYLFVAILSVIGYMIFIPTYGMWGAVWVTLFSECLIALLTFAVVSSTIKIFPSLVVFLKALISAAVMYFILAWIPVRYLALDLLLGGGIYIALIFSLGAVKISSLKTMFVSQK